MAKEIKLSNGKTVTMREPIMRDIRIVSGKYNPNADPVGYEMYLVANLSNMTLDEVDELSPNDYKKLVGELAPFLS